MKFFVFALFLTLFGVCFADESVGYFKDPAHPGKCVYQGLVLSAGEEGKVKGQCVRMLCGADSYATVQGCGAELVVPPCELGDYVNVDAPYAECCKRHVVCP